MSIVYPYAKVLQQWGALAQKWAMARGNLSAAEILSTIVEESSGNPVAINPGDPSWGLCGITLPIGKAYADVEFSSQLFDPDKNIQAGSGFVSGLKQRYVEKYPLGADPLSGYIQAYNLGETAFLRGERVPGYEEAYLGHVAAFNALMKP